MAKKQKRPGGFLLHKRTQTREVQGGNEVIRTDTTVSLFGLFPVWVSRTFDARYKVAPDRMGMYLQGATHGPKTNPEQK